MTSRTKQLDELFTIWEQSNFEYENKFVKDGIIVEEAYSAAETKILFITKEPNDPTQTSGDYREWWKSGVTNTFAYRIAEWSYGLLNNFPDYDKIWETKDSAHIAIQQVALMNIKKSGGGGYANYDQMIEHLKKNYNFLHQQIEIISPAVIMLGATWSELRNGLFPNTEWVKSGYDIFIGRHNNAKVIDFYHPSSRNAPAASYSLLQNIVRSTAFQNL